ncbi:SAM-dependent methyltransferase [Lentilactobacillus curieae]|uniref:SAM-dependent methyltransferase n=1 Tax=Lentilactobacillus curieae TaxID=1138822 RepID=A0A1S6QKM8_9LACO|nr:tRNA1(Val) (adenine(37)-N6)-methyltransferase [Lentilactobacillus curieae]AQW22164.1 SAM-dependent methyltransferase [Lentilactobacillus curieae]
MNAELKSGERIDQLYSKNISIIQSANVFSFSLDAVLLAEFASVSKNKTKTLVDLCAGNGAVGLFISERTNAKIYEIELQPRLADMATRSVKLNNLEDQVVVINDDLKNTTDHIKKDSVDVVTVNPPYFLNYDTSEKNPNEYLAIARHELTTTLNQVVKTSADLLKMNGKFFMVHRPDRLTDILTTMRHNRIEPKALQFVRPSHGKLANMVLVSGIKDGRYNGVKILDDVIVHDGDHYSKSIEMMLYGKR